MINQKILLNILQYRHIVRLILQLRIKNLRRKSFHLIKIFLIRINQSGKRIIFSPKNKHIGNFETQKKKKYNENFIFDSNEFINSNKILNDPYKPERKTNEPIVFNKQNNSPTQKKNVLKMKSNKNVQNESKKSMEIPMTMEPEKIKNKNILVSEYPTNQPVKYSHLDQFMFQPSQIDKNVMKKGVNEHKLSKQSISNGTYSNHKIDFNTMGMDKDNDIQVDNNGSGFWLKESENLAKNNNDKGNNYFTDEDFKKLEKKALPENYMGQNNEDSFQYF